MGKINILSKEAAEKIAAGEVVERPANAIKEMVENSIDAGAKSVVVEIRHGGVSYIRVTDDGGGVMADDMERAFMRHATSKIKDADDLEHITTLGFRGEALCSIAAVSRTEMISKTPESPLGSRIVVEGGETKLREETGCPDGTTVVVENLFYNTPARMKFLKKDSAEGAFVADVCQKQALSHPGVSLRLIRDGKEVFFTPGNNSLSDAVRSVWGKDFSQNMGEVRYQSGGIKVSGLAGKNNLSRPNRSMQIFFVNGRNVVNRTLMLALSEAYKNELMGGRFPAAVLDIEINPALCDVNVHPTKTEIKFADEQGVYNAVYWAVKNMLGAAAGAREVQASFVRQGASFKMAPPLQQLQQLEAKPQKFRQYTPAPIKNEDIIGSGKRDENILRTELKPFLPEKQIERLDEEYRQKLEKGEIKAPIIKRADLLGEREEKQQPEVPAEEVPTEKETAEEPAQIHVNIIGQLFSTYIVAEGEKELIFIDQHAAHERIRYEEIRQSGGKVVPQILMIPINVTLSPGEFDIVTENQEFLWDMGFDFEPMDKNSVMIRSVPSDCQGSDGGALFVEMAGALLGDGKGEISDRRDRAMYTLACKSAIKGNQELTKEEMETLVSRALALEGISTCPHGRPISVKITKYQIEKMFKRIV
ncbi:MAG: DNA mismatch repair endonuclease MutL [Clostridia bacterium]